VALLENVFGASVVDPDGPGLGIKNDASALWSLTAKTLDIAIALFSCAHVEEPYHSARQFSDEQPITLVASPDFFVGVELRSLRCLNGLLRSRRAWVFYSSKMSPALSRSSQKAPLYLTASITDLGDL
jgi:hypothetical protein